MEIFNKLFVKTVIILLAIFMKSYLTQEKGLNTYIR